MELKWYEFTQNNSGGYFEEDENVCHRMLIEASSFDEATEKAESLGCYWNGVSADIDCPCCGDRWNHYWEETINLNNYDGDIRVYAQDKADKWGWTTPDTRIFYANGTAEEAYSKRV